MTVSIIAKNTGQGLSEGTTVSSGILSVPNITQNIHVVPAGRRQKLQVRLTIRTMTTLQRVRVRQEPDIIFEDGTGSVMPPAETSDLGTYVLNAGQIISIGSGSPATSGATVILVISIIEDLPA